MRVVTFNLHSGRGPGSRTVDPGTFADVVAALNPDIVGLQEVDRQQARSGGVDLAAVAAEAMGAVSWRFAASLLGTPGRQWVAATDVDTLDQPAYGVALLSRYPAEGWEVLRLAPPRARVRVPSVFGLEPVLVGEEPRVALIATLDTPHGRLAVANAHLSVLPGWAHTQLLRLARQLAGLGDQRMILGDLNLGTVAARGLTGYRSLAGQPTFPAAWPLRQLDHVLLHASGLTVKHAEVRRLPFSDHRALIVDL